MAEKMINVAQEPEGIIVITLARPVKRNALSLELMENLRDAVVAASSTKAARVILFRAEGPVFCAGLDLKEAAAGNAERSAESLASMYAAICASPLVTIAAAQGAAVGGGAGLIAACDLVVAADDLRVGYPEVHRGLVAALVTCLLRRQADERTVRELVLLGQTIDASAALEKGLVNRVVPRAQLEAAAIDLARQACRGAPGAIARSKRLIDELGARPVEEDLRRALTYHLEARNSAEAAEGMRAFLEKRDPRWATE